MATTIAVANINSAPVLVHAIDDQAAAAGQLFSYSLPAGAFADPDAGDTLTYTAAVADGSPLPDWLSFNGATRAFSGTPATGDATDFDVTVTVTDASHASAADTFRIVFGDDFAGNSATSGTLAVGGTAAGNILVAGDQDWFKADLTFGVRYVIELKGESSASGTLHDPLVIVYDADGNVVRRGDNGGVGLDSRLDYTAGNGQTFFIAAAAPGAGTYTLSLKEALDDYTANSSTGGNLPIGSSIAGNVEVSGDKDYFRVQLVAGTAYQFDLKGVDSGHGTLGNPALTLHNALNTALRYDNDGGNPYQGDSTEAQIVFIPTESGTYYLNAGGWGAATGTYLLTATALDSDYYIQAVLRHPVVAWNEGSPLGTPVNVTFGFPNSSPSSAFDNYTAFSDVQKAAVRSALADISSYANITFSEVSDSTAQIRFGNVSQPTDIAATTTGTPSDGHVDIALASDRAENSTLAVGSFAYGILVHEIGHALGLKHPGNYNGSNGTADPPYLPTSQDAIQFTIETYNYGAVGNGKTPMVFDVAALQYLYGANTTAHAGDDSYTLSTRKVYAVWDTGGNDALDASSWTTSVTLDLNPGSVSYSGYLTDGAVLYPAVGIAFNSVIENAVGGAGSDKLIGNSGDNVLKGGPGSDRIDGGAGFDIAVFAGNAAAYTETHNSNGSVTVTGPDGSDTLLNIEKLAFDDGSQGKTVYLQVYVWKSHALLDGVAVTAAGADHGTGSDGSTCFNDVTDDSLSLAATHIIPAAETSLTSQAVNLQDAIATLKMIVGLDVNGAGRPLSPYQAIAADYDGSGAVDLVDAIGILKHVVGLAAPDPHWRFVNEADMDIATKANLNPGAVASTVNIDMTMTSNTVRVGMVGILSGDVDGSFAGAPGSLYLDHLLPAYFSNLTATYGLPASQFGVYG